MGVGEPAGLVGHRGRDLAPAVPDVDDDRATGGVEVLAARRRPGWSTRRASTATGGSATLERRKTRPRVHGRIVADETPGPGKGPGRGPETGRRPRQTRPFGTVCQYVLLKTILPRCQSWFGLGGLGGWS